MANLKKPTAKSTEDSKLSLVEDAPKGTDAKRKESVEKMSGIIEEANTLRLFDGDSDNVFEMLCGYKDPETGAMHTEFEVRDITGRDAEAVQKKDISSNGAKVATTLLARCVTRIGPYEASKLGQGKWHEVIRSLYVGDQDYMLMCLRKYSVDEDIEATHVCPNPGCKAKLKTSMSPDELEIIPFTTTSVAFELPKGFRDKKGELHKTGSLRLPTGFDRELLIPVASQNTAKAETLMLTRLMKFDDGYPVDDDVTGNLSIKDRSYLTSLQQDYYFGVKTNMDITCDTCGETFTASLNATNFL